MSGRSRFRTLLIALTAILTGLPAAAGETSDGKASGSWTDPPARTAPAPSTPAASTPTKAEEKAPPPARAERSADRPEAAPSRPVRRSAKLRREEIRQNAGRARTEPHAEAHPRALARTERPARRLVERMAAPRMAVRERQVMLRPRSRRPIYRYADPEPMTFAYGRRFASPAEGRMEDWDSPDVDERAHRIARARAAGFLVMRSRTYAYPDGVIVRRLSPLDDFDAD